MIKRNKNSRKLHNALDEKRGFTIVEIVIAIAVIAILTAVIIPTYSYLVERANDAKLRERIDSIYKSFIASSDNFGKSNYVLIELDEENICGRIIQTVENIEKDYETKAEEVKFKTQVKKGLLKANYEYLEKNLK